MIHKIEVLKNTLYSCCNRMKNLRTLKVEFYGGSKFPSWMGNPAFCVLSSISISSCSGCTFLPPLGQLPELKQLLVSGMPKVQCIGNEFYGSGGVPFPKLETLRFDNMPNWEKWTAFGDGEDVQIRFPHLQQLEISACGKLTDVSSSNFPFLRKLDIVACSKVLLERFCNLDSLIDLNVRAITGMSHLPRELMQSLAALEVLECLDCNELLSLWPSEIPPQHLTHLRSLVIQDCSQLVSLGEGDQQLPCNLKALELFCCANLVSLPNDLSNLRLLRKPVIQNCIKFLNFPENGIPPTVERLEILNCSALKSLPTNISNLKRLEIEGCSSLTTWATGQFPVALKRLSIKNCTRLEAVSDTMFPQDSVLLLEDLSLCNWHNFANLLQHLHWFSHLVELNLSKCHGLQRFSDQGLPPCLRALSIADCAHLESLPDNLQTMESLVSLEIRSCPSLNNFPEYDLPPNLSSLGISDSKKLKPLTQWGLRRLKSLREFSICGGYIELELLGDDDSLFPPSLIKFFIAGFPKLTSLCKVLENLKLLQHLLVMNCANVRDLPSEGLLEKLCHLEISDCPRLTQCCLKAKGDYWPKIAGIPRVLIS